MQKKFILFLVILIIISLLSGCQVSVDDVISKNIEKLEKSNPYLRKQAIASLGGTSDERVIIPITKMLSDSDQGVVDQAYIELNKLREYGLLVDLKILESHENLNEKQRSAVLKYLIVAHQNGIDLQPTLLRVLPKVRDINRYAEFIVFLNSRVDSNFYATLLTELSKENGAVAASALLLLDRYGYSPPKALVDELIKQGSAITEATGQLLVQFACRSSYTNINNPNDQLQIYYREGEININDRSEKNQLRCQTGDELYNKVPKDLSYISRLGLLKSDSDTTKEVSELFNTLMSIDQSSFLKSLISDKDSLENNEIRNELIAVLATNQAINDSIESELNPLDITAVIAQSNDDSGNDSDESEENTANNNTDDPDTELNTILIINAVEGNIITKYHWYLNDKYRPKSQDEIRYVMSVPKDKGVLTIVDLYKKNLVLEKEMEEGNIYSIIDKFILTIQ